MKHFPLVPVFALLAPPSWSQQLPYLLGDVSPVAAATDSFVAAARDGTGGAFAGGHRPVGSNDEDALLVRVSADGSTLWETTFGATQPAQPNGPRQTRIIALEDDGAGGVFAAGQVSGEGFAGPSQGGMDGFVAHLDAQGMVLWATRVASDGSESVIGLCLDGSGGVFAVGSASGGSLGGAASALMLDTFVARLDTNGTIQFATRHTRPNVFTLFTSVTPDGTGGVFCGGSTTQPSPPYNTVLTARYDGAGGEIWSMDDGSIDFAGGFVTSDGAGGFFYGGHAFASSGTDQGLLERRDSTGHVLWSRTAGLCGAPFCSGITTVEALEVDANGDVLVAGASGVAAQAYVARYSPQGDLLGRHILELNITFSSSRYFDALLDAGGRLLAFGDGRRPASSAREPLMSRYAWTALGTPLGSSLCAVEPNSTGLPGRTRADGSNVPSDNAVTLWSSNLPRNVIGIFLGSQTRGFTAFPGGSSGNLCLDGEIGRFNRPGEVQFSGNQRGFYLDVDLTAFPSPTGTTEVFAGETWYFQTWHRDTAATPTSQFTDALAISF